MCLETRQDLEVGIPSITRQPLRSIQETSVAYRRQGH